MNHQTKQRVKHDTQGVLDRFEDPEAVITEPLDTAQIIKEVAGNYSLSIAEATEILKSLYPRSFR